MSSQMGSPEGLSALCGSASPNASAATCADAAVPRNWQPPPGVPQARQPMVAASSSVMRPWANRAPMDWTLPASSPSIAGSVTPPGTMMPGNCGQPASASSMAGRPLSHVAIPMTPARPGNDRDETAQRDRRVVAVGQAVEHTRSALRPAVARVAATGGERYHPFVAQRLGRGPDEQAELPVPGVVAQRDGAAVGIPQPALCAQDEIVRSPGFGGIPAHARVLGHAEQGAARLLQEQLRRDGEPPFGPARRRAGRIEQLAAAKEDVRDHPATSCCDHSPSMRRHILPVGFLSASSGGSRWGRTLS